MNQISPVPYEGNKSYLFISYAHMDKDAVYPILDRMAQMGLRIWFDEAIIPGTEWDDSIARHVKESDALIAFISANYIASENCRDELKYARDLKKEFLLIYLEDVVLPDGMAMRMSRLQAIHQYSVSSQEAFFAKLMKCGFISRNKDEEKKQEHRFYEQEQEHNTVQREKKYIDRTLLLKGEYNNIETAKESDTGKTVLVKTCLNEYYKNQIPYLYNEILAQKLIETTRAFPGLCPVLDINRQEGMLVMEYLQDGRTVGEVMANRILRNKISCIGIVKDVLLGLSALHDQDIYHGDLSPDNVMVSDGKGILIDYDMTGFNNKDYCEVTVTQKEYQSPEKWKGQIIDYRSDIFEAGILLDLLTIKVIRKREPFQGIITGKDIGEVQYEDSWIIYKAEWYKRIFEIVKKATATKPEDRYQKASEMLHDLEMVDQ